MARWAFTGNPGLIPFANGDQTFLIITQFRGKKELYEKN